MNNLPIVNGVKLYPVGNWMNNQHKFYNHHDRCMNNLYERSTNETIQKADESDELLSAFDNGYQVNGIVYVPYKYYKRMKEIIVEYDIRHDHK